MKRARATALALVNWKGVFYERYLLDPNVTALEGANGAGKTTVMVAAYVVLLPDLTRLRFSNVGESGGGGGDRGLRGRLGVPDRPSYAALEFQCADGEHFVAGVHLAQRAAELVLTPFTFSGVPLGGSLKDLLLITTAEHDEVPELAQVKERALALGGMLNVHASAKEYFASMFERGVFPLRLQTDEERRNWNELLRTSMSGGISKALTTELRSFLLKEETGLSDTLQRMRETLDACRRTRAEVRDSTRLESEIGGVYEAGLAMFEAATAGYRALHRETEKSLASARDEARRTQLARDEAATAVDVGRAREAAAQEQLARSRVRANERATREAALSRLRELEIAVKLLESTAAAAVSTERTAHAALTALQDELTYARRTQAGVRGAYEEAAVGLSNLQEGLEELHRIVHLARQRRELTARIAERKVQHPAVESLRVDELDAKLLTLERRHAGHELSHHQHAAAFALLQRLDPEAAVDDALARAQAVASQHAHDLAKTELVPTLQAEVERARADRRGFVAALELARAAGIEPGPGTLARTRTALAHAHEARRQIERAKVDGERRLEALHADVAMLGADVAFRREFLAAHTKGHDNLAALRADLEAPTASALELRNLLGARQLRLTAERQDAIHALAEAERWLSEHAGESGVPESIARLAEALGGELLATRFEEVDDETATCIEAELGALQSAIVVDDLAAAKQALTHTEPHDVILVRADAALAVAERSTLDGERIWVDESYGARLVGTTRLAGLIGRNRRQQREREMRQVATSKRALLSTFESVDATVAEWSEALAAAHPIELAAEPPAEQLAHVEQRLEHAQREAAETLARAAELATELATTFTREAALAALAEQARDLEQPDPELRVARAEQALAEAHAAETRAAERGRDVAELSLVVDALGVAPDRIDALNEILAQTRILRDAAFGLAGLQAELTALGAAPRDEDVAAAEASLQNGTGARAATMALWEERQAQLHRADAEVVRLEAAIRDTSATWQRAALEREVGERQLAEKVAALHAADTSAVQNALSFEIEEVDVARAETLFADAMAMRVRAEEDQRRAEDAARAALSWEAESSESAGEKLAVFEHFVGEAERAGLQLPAEAAARSGIYKDSFAEADSRGRLLVDRLQNARGGASAAERITELLGAGAFVGAWAHARAWLTERLPLPLAELPDPHSALDRLRAQLGELEATLNRQETDLRGASGDVARGIDVRVRRAKATVRRMNQHLGKVQFGSVSAIRVDLLRVAKMDAVLEALRDGKTQELLFDPSMPLEQAFEEIFRRFAGGGRGADRLLDYREYLELAVMVQRRGKTEWELATPARLSTGEAIGVGASLLMVVLTEWEQASQMFRKASSGSLRFLFLDEANRLSSDNLGVLFELCEKLSLQLLLAAPEVAQAHGNTTYRLVRRIDEAGHEEVVVSGRRLVPHVGEFPEGVAPVEGTA